MPFGAHFPDRVYSFPRFTYYSTNPLLTLHRGAIQPAALSPACMTTKADSRMAIDGIKSRRQKRVFRFKEGKDHGKER